MKGVVKMKPWMGRRRTRPHGDNVFPWRVPRGAVSDAADRQFRGRDNS